MDHGDDDNFEGSRDDSEAVDLLADIPDFGDFNDPPEEFEAGLWGLIKIKQATNKKIFSMQVFPIRPTPLSPSMDTLICFWMEWKPSERTLRQAEIRAHWRRVWFIVSWLTQITFTPTPSGASAVAGIELAPEVDHHPKDHQLLEQDIAAEAEEPIIPTMLFMPTPPDPALKAFKTVTVDVRTRIPGVQNTIAVRVAADASVANVFRAVQERVQVPARRIAMIGIRVNSDQQASDHVKQHAHEDNDDDEDDMHDAPGPVRSKTSTKKGSFATSLNPAELQPGQRLHADDHRPYRAHPLFGKILFVHATCLVCEEEPIHGDVEPRLSPKKTCGLCESHRRATEKKMAAAIEHQQRQYAHCTKFPCCEGPVVGLTRLMSKGWVEPWSHVSRSAGTGDDGSLAA